MAVPKRQLKKLKKKKKIKWPIKTSTRCCYVRERVREGRHVKQFYYYYFFTASTSPKSVETSTSPTSLWPVHGLGRNSQARARNPRAGINSHKLVDKQLEPMTCTIMRGDWCFNHYDSTTLYMWRKNWLDEIHWKHKNLEIMVYLPILD